MNIPSIDKKEKYLIFNFVTITLCIFLLLRFAFVTEYINPVLLAVILFLVFSLLTTFIKSNKVAELSKFFFVICLGIFLRVIVMISIHSGSDVFWGSKGEIESLLHGINPYTSTFPVYGNSVIHAISNSAYFPFTILYEMPFQEIFGDLRTGIIFADVGIAILLYLIIRDKNEDIARAASSFYLLVTSLSFLGINAVFDYRVSDGLTDPIMTFFLLLSYYSYSKNKGKLSSFLLGISVATRQFSILFAIPMLLLWLKKDESGKRQYRLIFISLLTFLIIVLPFFIWSPLGFIHATFGVEGNVPLSPSLGLPQWNMAIFPQLAFLGFNITLTVAKLIQISSVLILLAYYGNKIIRVNLALRCFLLIYIVFLATNNFTQYFYWFNVLPYLMIVFFDYYKEQKEIDKKIT